MGIETRGLLDTEGDLHFQTQTFDRLSHLFRWVMMYNANLDKTVGRKSLPDMRLELRTWEEGQKGHKYVVEDTSAYEVGLISVSVLLWLNRRTNC